MPSQREGCVTQELTWAVCVCLIANPQSLWQFLACFVWSPFRALPNIKNRESEDHEADPASNQLKLSGAPWRDGWDNLSRHSLEACLEAEPRALWHGGPWQAWASGDVGMICQQALRWTSTQACPS